MFLIFLAFVSTGCALCLWLMNELSNSRKRLPGPIQFPFIGSMLQVATTHSVGYLAIHKLSQRYGDAMSIKLGIEPYVFVSSFESIKHFYGGEDCVDRPCSGIWKERNFHKNIGLLFANGPTVWGDMRKFITQRWRTSGPLNKTWLREVLQEEVFSFMKHVEGLASSSPDRAVGFKHSGFVNVSFTNLLLAMLNGKGHENYDDPKLMDLVTALEKFLHASTVGTSIMTAYPWLRFLFGKSLGYDTQLKSVQEVNKYSEELIRERMKFGNYKNGEPACFIDAFLLRMEIEKNNSEIFSHEALLVVIADFFTAGTQSVPCWLLSALLLLMSHPEKQEKMYQEIRTKVGDRPIELEDKNDMIYTQAVMLEVFRWAKVTINLGPRQSIRDFEYKGRIVKKGTNILANMYSVYEDKMFWGDPHIFRPERFIDDNNENGKLVKEKAEQIIPFGAGKRICVGEILAKESGFMYLATFIQKYRFELPEEYTKNPPSLELVEGITTCMKPFSAKLVKRD